MLYWKNYGLHKAQTWTPLNTWNELTSMILMFKWEKNPHSLDPTSSGEPFQEEWKLSLRAGSVSMHVFENESPQQDKRVWFSVVHVICSSNVYPLLWVSCTEGLNSRMNDKEAHIWTSFKTSCGCVCVSSKERES